MVEDVVARQLDGATDRLQSGNSYDISGSYTLMCWLRAGTAPQVQNSSQVAVKSGGNTTDAGFSYDHASGSFRQSAFHRESGGTYKSAVLTTSLQANTWYCIGARYDAGASELTAWLNGVKEATTGSVAAASTTQGNLDIHRQDNSSTSVIRVSWCVLWNGAALSDNEMIVLARGIEPTRVRPSSISLACPFWGVHSPEIDLTGSTITVTGTSKETSAPTTLFTPKRAASIPLIESALAAAQRRRVGTGAGWAARR